MHLLFVANFATDAGYAWETIEAVLRGVGEQLVREGHRVTVAYADMPEGPSRRMRGAPFQFIEFDYNRVYTAAGLREFLQLLHVNAITTLYLTDRETWSPRYALYRRAGVQHIILHDRTSGLRTVRPRPVRALKRLLHNCAPLAADCYVGVSRFVQQRLVESNGTPPNATHLVYNGIDLSRFATADGATLHQITGLSRSTPIVFCSGRVEDYKGFQTVVDAAALLRQGTPRDLAFVLCGDGPFLPELRARAQDQRCDNFFFLGRRSDIPQLLRSASIAVVPSLWHEAFGLTVVEAMAAEVPLIATRVGGIPELIQDGVTGLLVEPADPATLAHSIEQLIDDPEAGARMARDAAAIVQQRFSLERVTSELHAVVASLFLGNGVSMDAPDLRRTHATLLMNSSRRSGRY